MKHPPFDPKKAVTFDLAHGQVHLGGGQVHLGGGMTAEGHQRSDSRRAVIVPAAALAALTAAGGSAATHDAGRALGRALGARVAERFGGEEKVREAGVAAVASELASEVAMVGMGELAFERWGQALLAVVYGAPAGCDALIAATVEGALSAATARELRTLPLATVGGATRVLIANVAAVERVIGWLGEGVSWGDAITRLHERASGVSA